ncbi:MAG: DEAD/DEAH box helicase family protein [Saprospiraceae bacterium]|nr:DEAD/DEAH box helicase family protein [Saprospiraceae bacterium]
MRTSWRWQFFSITLPTGFGKTFCAYNAAFLLQKKFATANDGSVPRIIYALPFTSVIDQNDDYLSLPNKHYDEQELQNDEPEYLAEGWEQEVVVTTFVQLLEGIFTNRNRSLRKFHNMTNAVILLDEVQNVPAKYFEAIELVFKAMAEYFNTKFIFITATQPFLFANEKEVLESDRP